MVHFFESEGLRLAYIDVAPHGRDRGEPILLIHGFASNHRVNWVNPRWVETLTHDGRRVIAFDNRGHGQSDKPSDPAAYHSALMAADAARLLDHLGVARADVMGYSMGARISAFLALASPDRVRRLLLGGLGDRLVEGVGLPLGIADAMEAPSLDALTDPMQRMFRAFADQTKSDRVALAACIRGSRQTLRAPKRRASPVRRWWRSERATRSPAIRAAWRRCCRTRACSKSPAATTISPSATRSTKRACWHSSNGPTQAPLEWRLRRRRHRGRARRWTRPLLPPSTVRREDERRAVLRSGS